MKAFRIVGPRASEDAVVTLLWERGTAGVEMREDGPAGELVLLAYFDAPADDLAAAVLAAAPGARVEPATIATVDWVARFREGFRPFQAGRFRIVPAWLAPAQAGPHELVVDPGRAFGTGTHETTRLCLSLLEDLAASGPLGRVADIGAGTGLLAIAALRLGASAAVALDVDPDCVAAAGRHAALNRARLGVVLGDGPSALRTGAFDLVLANLTAPLLRRLGPDLVRLLAPGGSLVASGFLEEDTDGVRAALGAVGAAERRDGEWVALLARWSGA